MSSFLNLILDYSLPLIKSNHAEIKIMKNETQGQLFYKVKGNGHFKS